MGDTKPFHHPRIVPNGHSHKMYNKHDQEQVGTITKTKKSPTQQSWMQHGNGRDDNVQREPMHKEKKEYDTSPLRDCLAVDWNNKFVTQSFCYDFLKRERLATCEQNHTLVLHQSWHVPSTCAYQERRRSRKETTVAILQWLDSHAIVFLYYHQIQTSVWKALSNTLGDEHGSLGVHARGGV